VNNLDDLLTIAQEAVEIGYKLMTTADMGEVHQKGDRDLVTDLDLRIQREVRAFLEQATPDFDFLGEEQGGGALDESAEYVWALDPIDGTSNFAHGIPLCASQLALVHRGEPIIGVIVAPFLALRYQATKDGGAFCNGKGIHASTTTDLSHAIVSVGDYATGPNSAEKNERRFAVTKALAENVERVRMFGSAALDLAFLAEGRIDACVILANKPWDTAPGVLIARSAGALVTDGFGSSHTFRSRETVGLAEGVSKGMQEIIVTLTDSGII
jgi:myo-inositol-1(or 4)-monophosphatase